jgi:ankyrin repeat protein
MLGRLENLKKMVDDGDVVGLRNATGGLLEDGFKSLVQHALSKGKAGYVYLVITSKELHEESSKPDRDVMNSICENNCEELVKDLSTKELKDKTKVLSLLFLLANDRFEDVREFLNSDGEKSDGEKEILREVFRFALGLGDVNSMLKVLELGVDVNTALILAAEKGYAEVVKALLDKGADINVRSDDGSTALILAAEEGHEDVVKALLDKGADINLQSKDGSTALILAAEEGHAEIVKALLGKGADINVQCDDDGSTALILAAEQDHKEIVKLLIRHGADPSIENKKKKTALDVASSDAMKNIIREEWARTKLYAVVKPALYFAGTVGCAGAAYGMLALTAVNSLLAGAAIGAVLAFLLERTCSQGIEDIAYKVYTNLHMTRYNLDASSETSPAVQAG